MHTICSYARPFCLLQSKGASPPAILLYKRSLTSRFPRGANCCWCERGGQLTQRVIHWLCGWGGHCTISGHDSFHSRISSTPFGHHKPTFFLPSFFCFLYCRFCSVMPVCHDISVFGCSVAPCFFSCIRGARWVVDRQVGRAKPDLYLPSISTLHHLQR